MKVAFLFPGQGAQKPGMLSQLPSSPIVLATLAEANDVLGSNVFSLENEEALVSTVNVQLALLVHEVVSARLLMKEGAVPDVVAGHSVGAFAAAVIAGSLTFADALWIVSLRGKLMSEAFPTNYGMAVVSGIDEKNVRRLAETVDQVYIANINAPDQMTLAGSKQGLASVLELCRAAGAQKVQYIPVSVPSHCELLQPVGEALTARLADMTVKNGRIPYVGNCRARLLRKGEDIQRDLALGVAHSVRWHDMTSLLVELGVELFVEAGPGQVLTTMAAKAFPTIRAIALENSGLSSAILLVKRARRVE